jgi:integrase
MFDLAVRQEWIETNPARGIEKHREQKRERYLSPAEIGRLMEALAAHPERVSADAIRLMLLTGSRRGETLSSTWDQFDLERGIWTKPASATKQARNHRVPLSPEAVEVIRGIKARQDAQAAEAQCKGIIRPVQRYLFPSSKGKPLHAVRTLWLSLCRQAGIDQARVHDLRHTYASILVSSGLSLPIVGALLGHSNPATTNRYAHLADDPLREATELSSNVIAATKTAGGKIVPLKK